MGDQDRHSKGKGKGKEKEKRRWRQVPTDHAARLAMEAKLRERQGTSWEPPPTEEGSYLGGVEPKTLGVANEGEPKVLAHEAWGMRFGQPSQMPPDQSGQTLPPDYSTFPDAGHMASMWPDPVHQEAQEPDEDVQTQGGEELSAGEGLGSWTIPTMDGQMAEWAVQSTAPQQPAPDQQEHQLYLPASRMTLDPDQLGFYLAHLNQDGSASDSFSGYPAQAYSQVDSRGLQTPPQMAQNPVAPYAYGNVPQAGQSSQTAQHPGSTVPVPSNTTAAHANSTTASVGGARRTDGTPAEETRLRRRGAVKKVQPPPSASEGRRRR